MFYAAVFSKFISGTPSLERIKLCAVPTKALSFRLLHLHKNLHDTILLPNPQQLHIESTPLYSGKSLLEDLAMLSRRRKDFWVPL